MWLINYRGVIIMWIYLVLVFSVGEPIEVTMKSVEACQAAVTEALEKAPHLESATCEVRSTNWKEFI